MNDIVFRLKLAGAVLAFAAINVAGGYYLGSKACARATGAVHTVACPDGSHPTEKQIKAGECPKAPKLPVADTSLPDYSIRDYNTGLECFYLTDTGQLGASKADAGWTCMMPGKGPGE